MAALNPYELLNLLKNGNPKTVAEEIIQKNYPQGSTMQQLLNMGEQGDIASLENYAKQFFSSQGKDYNLEMKRFMDLMRRL